MGARRPRAYVKGLLDEHALVQVVQVPHEVLDILEDALKEQVKARDDLEVALLERVVAVEQVLLAPTRWAGAKLCASA